MTVKECYEQMGGNYDDVMSRLRTDERITKFLIKVADDHSYELLCDSIASNNVGDAFRAAHTLKGVCMNLSLTRLYTSADRITEALRGKTEIEPNVADLLKTVAADYDITISAIKQLAQTV